VSFTYDIKEVKVNSTTNERHDRVPHPAADRASTTQTPVTFVAPAASVSNPLAGLLAGRAS